MCRRLSEYLAGHAKALSIVRIPSPQEEDRRAQRRMREQLFRQMRRVQAMGRSLLLQTGDAAAGALVARGNLARALSRRCRTGSSPSWRAGSRSLSLPKNRCAEIEVQLSEAAPASCALARASSPTNC